MNNMLTRASAAALIIGAALSTHAAVIDRVVATVDDEPILQSDLYKEVGPYLRTLSEQGESADVEAQFQAAMEEALDQAVEQRVLYREALLAGVQIDDDLIEERIQKIRDQYETREDFMRVLDEAGETVAELRERVRKQVIALGLGIRKRNEFEQQAVVSESEAAQYFEDNRADFARPEQVRLRRIFIPAGNDAERARAAAQLESLADEIALGADFAELAKTYSQGPAAEDGGLVGWVKRGDLVAELEEAAFALNAGESSSIVTTDFGVHLLQVTERREAGNMSFEEARKEIEPILRQQYADERYAEWIRDLRNRSRVIVFL